MACGLSSNNRRIIHKTIKYYCLHFLWKGEDTIARPAAVNDLKYGLHVHAIDLETYGQIAGQD